MASVGCHSSALIADKGDSISNMFLKFVTLWAVQVARLPLDDNHPYNHGKCERVGLLFLLLTLMWTGLSVGVTSYKKFLQVINEQPLLGIAPVAKLVHIPTWPAIVMAGMSIASNGEWLSRITRWVDEEVNSQVVIVNAWHHQSDAYSLILALILIGLAMAVPGVLAADPVAGILVARMIAMTGAKIIGKLVKQLMDTVPDETLVRNVGMVSSNDANIKGVTCVRVRHVASSALVNVDVKMSPDLSASCM